jgi:hypothetical protein
METSITKSVSIAILCLFLFGSWLYPANQERIIIQTPFKPIKPEYPDYPEFLKKEGVAARVRVLISIDRKGNVTKATIHCLYPELKAILLEKVTKWKFEPLIHRGEPISAFGYMTFIFYPGEFRLSIKKTESAMKLAEEEPPASPNEELQQVLLKCTEYSLKLSESALDYVCHEKISEKCKKIEELELGLTLAGSPDLGPNELMQAEQKILRLGSVDKHVYLYDCQLIRKEGVVKEKLILMEKDGKSPKPDEFPQETKPLYALKPILVPIQIFGVEHRTKFSFRIADDDKINGKWAYVLEVSLRPGQTGNIRRGRIWVDKSDFRVVEAEIETDFLEGYEEIFEECQRHYLRPHFRSTHYYEIDKNGLLFPSRSEIRVDYSGLLTAKKDLKSEVEITYRNYKFLRLRQIMKSSKRK